ncbi:MAG: hypothetical protein EOP48_22125, partial [Sphingobacteriales bacterium]
MFFGDWLFQYGELDRKQEIVRRLFTAEIVRDENCQKILVSNKDKLIQILSNADSNDVLEFKQRILSLLKDYSNDNIQI